jgi:photosystem II stability/assembly factor-like uncharacterized protein
VSDIRAEIRAAFESEQSGFPSPRAVQAEVTAAVHSDSAAAAPARQRAGRNWLWRTAVIASVPVQQSPNRSFKTLSFQWAAGFVAVLLAVVLVAALVYSRSSLGPSGSASPGISSAPAGPFAFVSMMNATSGWVDTDQNGHPSHTTDGGAHWTDVSPPEVFVGGTSSAYFLNADRAWVMDASWGSSPVQLVSQRTIDGGRTWQKGARFTFDVGAASTPDADSQGGLRLDFLDPEHGWLFVAALLQSKSPLSKPRRDALYSTSDGGTHWRLVSTNTWSFTTAPLTTGCPWGAPIFISLTTGYMISPDRTYETGRTSNCPLPNRTSLHVTHDGGVTWQFQPLSDQFGTNPVVLDAPTFVDQLHGFLMLQTLGGSSLLATSDGGSTWEVRSLPRGSSGLSISWLDDRSGSAFDFDPGSPTVPLYRTRDGGSTWTPVRTNLVSDTQDGQIGGLYFVDQNTGFAFRQMETGGYSLLLKTTDGGHTWTAVGHFK